LSVASTVESFLARFAGTSLGRGVIAGLGAFSVTEILNHFLGHPDAKASLPGTKYAIVDLHSNTVISFVSRKRVYRFLTRAKSRRRTIRIVTVPEK
jgi:hypothetical protein